MLQGYREGSRYCTRVEPEWIVSDKCEKGCPLLLWNSEEMSLEVQSRTTTICVWSKKSIIQKFTNGIHFSKAFQWNFLLCYRVLSPPTTRRKRGRPPKEVSSPSRERKPTVLTETKTVFGCPLCTYTVECRDELDRHLRRAHKMSLHNCEFCKKSFSDKYKLHKHFLSCE